MIADCMGKFCGLVASRLRDDGKAEIRSGRYALCSTSVMPRGSKAKYTDKQKRKAGHIEKSYESRGAPKNLAEKRAWQTVNKQSGGGEKSGGGRKATSGAKRAARKESGQRAARSRKVGSRKVQRRPTRHKASTLAKRKKS